MKSTPAASVVVLALNGVIYFRLFIRHLSRRAWPPSPAPEVHHGRPEQHLDVRCSSSQRCQTSPCSSLSSYSSLSWYPGWASPCCKSSYVPVSPIPRPHTSHSAYPTLRHSRATPGYSSRQPPASNGNFGHRYCRIRPNWPRPLRRMSLPNGPVCVGRSTKVSPTWRRSVRILTNSVSSEWAHENQTRH